MTEPIEPEQPDSPIEHESWCVRSPEAHAAHNACYGLEHQTPLSRYPSERMTDGSNAPDAVTVYAERESGIDAPHVFLGRIEATAWAELAPAEAASLRDSLTRVLDEMGYTTD